MVLRTYSPPFGTIFRRAWVFTLVNMLDFSTNLKRNLFVAKFDRFLSEGELSDQGRSIAPRIEPFSQCSLRRYECFQSGSAPVQGHQVLDNIHSCRAGYTLLGLHTHHQRSIVQSASRGTIGTVQRSSSTAKCGTSASMPPYRCPNVHNTVPTCEALQRTAVLTRELRLSTPSVPSTMLLSSMTAMPTNHRRCILNNCPFRMKHHVPNNVTIHSTAGDEKKGQNSS